MPLCQHFLSETSKKQSIPTEEYTTPCQSQQQYVTSTGGYFSVTLKWINIYHLSEPETETHSSGWWIIAVTWKYIVCLYVAIKINTKQHSGHSHDCQMCSSDAYTCQNHMIEITLSIADTVFVSNLPTTLPVKQGQVSEIIYYMFEPWNRL
jgi:hypothetical protein